MPLISGQKMACEPCIRGHRSTKCTHANERLMVPVRKPGRPLSTCPHPASRPCSCAAVTAAIPKKQNCGCGTLERLSAGEKAHKEGSSSGAAPTSPSTFNQVNSSPYRVRKSTSKSSSGRKPAHAAGLERMDASQLNMLSPLDAGQQQLPTPTPPNGAMVAMPNLPGYGTMGFMPSGNSFGPEPTMFPLFPQPMPSPIPNPAAPTKPTANGHYSPQMDGLIGSSTTSTPGSCCETGRVSQGQPSAQQAPNSENRPKSRFSSAADSSNAKSQADPIPAPEVRPANGMMMPAFQAPLAMPHGMYPYFPQPSIFAYPPQFGSYLQPLQPEQWRRMMLTTVNCGRPTPSNAYGGPAAMPFKASGVVNGGSWTSHQCSCGDSCQCVGCVTHPYNQATQEYVRSAWNTPLEDAQQQQEIANGSQSMDSSSRETSPNRTLSGIATPAVNEAEDTIPPPAAAQTPSDIASSLSEEQALSANDFFFVSYPFEDSCEGDMVSCPCGDDCQCIGCAIHNNDNDNDDNNNNNNNNNNNPGPVTH